MRRVVLTALAAALAVVPSSAAAGFTPKLTVGAGAAGGVAITAAVSSARDDPTAKVTIYVPRGYRVAAASPGTKIGEVVATAQAADLGGEVLPLAGDLLAVDPVRFAAEQPACGLTTVLATWDLHVNAAGQTLDIPMYVASTAGAEAAVGVAKLVVCLPPPDVPAGTPGRAAFGAKLLSLAVDATALTRPSTRGEFRWTSVWTPYTPTTGNVNAAGSVEAQSLVRTPTQLELAVKKTRVVERSGRKRLVTTQVTATAAVTAGGNPIHGISVTVLVNGKRLGAAKTGAAGTVPATFRLARGTATISAAAEIRTRDLGVAGCVKTAIFGGIPCSDATVDGATVRATTTVAAFKR